MNVVLEELRINENIGEGNVCILIDAGIYFPYANQDLVTFDVILMEDIVKPPQEKLFFRNEEWSHKKRNHRYPNNGYVTLSKTYGRRVSHFGYPFVCSPNQALKYKYLCAKIGIKNQYMLVYFPLKLNIDQDNPYTWIMFHVRGDIPDNVEFDIRCFDRFFEGGYMDHIYMSGDIEDSPWKDIATKLSFSRLQNEELVAVCNETIESNGMPYERALGGY